MKRLEILREKNGTGKSSSVTPFECLEKVQTHIVSASSYFSSVERPDCSFTPGLRYVGFVKPKTRNFLMELSSMKMSEREHYNSLFRLKNE